MMREERQRKRRLQRSASEKRKIPDLYILSRDDKKVYAV